MLVNTYLAGNWSIFEGEKPCSTDYALCRAYYFSRQLSKLASFPGQYLITYSTVRKYSEGRPGRSGHVREGLGDQVMRGKAWEIRSCEGRPGRSGHAREGLGDRVMRGKAWEIRSCEGMPGRSGHAREGLGGQVMRGKAWEIRSCEGRPGRSGHVRSRKVDRQ